MNFTIAFQVFFFPPTALGGTGWLEWAGVGHFSSTWLDANKTPRGYWGHALL